MQIKDLKGKKKISPNSPGSLEKMQDDLEKTDILKHDGKIEKMETRINNEGQEELGKYPENPYEEIAETE